MDGVGDRPGRTDSSVEPHCFRHDGRSRRRIARHHHGAHAQSVQFADERRRVWARRIAESDESCELHGRRGPGGDRQHSEALCFEFVRRSHRGRRRLREADDHGGSALHNPLRAARRIRRGRLRHLLGDGLPRGRRANGSVDRVLAAIGTRQRGQRQNVRLVEAGHRRTVVTVNALRVSVPVLSAHKTLIDAASSTAERRVGRTPCFAKARAPSAAARVKVAGSATGIDASTAVRTRGMTSSSGSLRIHA
jgi:hypothetical protein